MIGHTLMVCGAVLEAVAITCFLMALVNGARDNRAVRVKAKKEGKR